MIASRVHRASAVPADSLESRSSLARIVPKTNDGPVGSGGGVETVTGGRRGPAPGGDLSFHRTHGLAPRHGRARGPEKRGQGRPPEQALETLLDEVLRSGMLVH